MIENTFGINIIPDDDAERLKTLARYRIMDTPSEDCFDNIAKLATQIFQVPISLVSLVDAERVFFKANVGMGKATEANRGKSLCALAVLDPDVTVFEDALKEPCLIANPNVAGDFGLRFYAGAPLVTHDGFLIGTLCIIDKQPRVFTKKDEEILKGLAVAIMDQVELRLSALQEIGKQQTINSELITEREESHAMNEELIAINEELRQSQEYLKISNDSLSESESRFRDLVSQAPVAIAIYSGPELIIEQANEQMLNLWGRGGEIIGLPLLTARPEIKNNAFAAYLNDIYTTGQQQVGHNVKGPVARNGQMEERYFDVIYKALKDNTSSVTGVIVVAIDVTERFNADSIQKEMQAEMAAVNEELTATNDDLRQSQEHLLQSVNNLAASESRFRLITDNISQLAWMADAEGSVFWYNTRWFEFTGTTLDEMLGWDWKKVHHPDHVDRVAKKITRHFKSGEIWEDTFPILGADGEYRWFLSRAVPARDDNGEILGWFGTNTDVHEQRMLEQRKDDFLSIASHELKTPITSLKASLQLLDMIKERPASPMHIRLIEQSNRSMEKMSALIDDLLNVNRLTEGQLQLDLSTFTIAEMLNVCCNHVRIAGKDELVIQGDKDLQITADEHRIDQVVVNFVNNAVKYAPDSKDIYLIVEKIDGKAKISVRDTGPGIDKEKLPFLFDRYYRVNHTGKGYTGLGLGLYICAEIVKRHKGEIGVNSEVGKGSTFWFTIPL